MIYSQVFPGLYIINLDQKLEGFRNFISSWLYTNKDTTFLVDPGPAYSTDKLLSALKDIGIKKIDYILLTHIHIDHAGGAGEIAHAFPEAKIICHEKAIKHMTDPSKLWEGSLKILGDVARAYGEIIPVPADRIIFKKNISTESGVIQVIETPGHAVHHLSFLFNDFLFAGEVAGVNQTIEQGNYGRPATPPKFKLEISLNSLDKTIALEPEIICFGHYGFRKDAMTAMQNAKKQLLLWTEIIKEELLKEENDLNKRIIKTLEQRDSAFANFKYLDDDIKKREIYFLGNSIKGIKEYIEAI